MVEDSRRFLGETTKYWECPHCGFTNRFDRNQKSGQMNSSRHVSIIENNPLETGNTTIYGIKDLVLPKLSLDGTANNNVRPTFNVEINTGCWFCGFVKEQ